jgi:hypothetical protein
MITHVDATLTNGVLKPDRPLPLSDQTRVRLTIEPIEEHPSHTVSPEEAALVPDEKVVRAAMADFEASRYRTL